MPLPDFTFPPLFARLGAHLPGPLASAPLIAALTVACHQHWLDVPETLHGRRFLLRVDDLGLCARFQHDGKRFLPLPASQPVDLTLSARAVDFAALVLGHEDADTLFFRRKLRVEGDTELGVAVKYWLDASERPAWLRALAARIGELGGTGAAV